MRPKVPNRAEAAHSTIAVVIASSLHALAQQSPTPSRVRGTIEGVDGDVLSVKSRSGEDVKLHMTGDMKVVGIVKISLADVIVLGGIHDHLGGGFHRYSTDRIVLPDGTPAGLASDARLENNQWRVQFSRSFLGSKYVCLTIPANVSEPPVVVDGRCQIPAAESRSSREATARGIARS